MSRTINFYSKRISSKTTQRSWGSGFLLFPVEKENRNRSIEAVNALESCLFLPSIHLLPSPFNKHSDTTKRTNYTHINTYVFTPVCTRTRAHIEWKMKHSRKEERNPPSVFLFPQIYVWSVSLYFFFVFLSASPLLSRNFLPLFQSCHTPPCMFGHRGRKKDVGRKLRGG